MMSYWGRFFSHIFVHLGTHLLSYILKINNNSLNRNKDVSPNAQKCVKRNVPNTTLTINHRNF